MAGDELRSFVAANVRQLRERRGQSQQDVADEVGVSPRYYRDIEAGVVNLTLETLARLARAVDVEAMELLRPARLKKRGPGRPKTTTRT